MNIKEALEIMIESCGGEDLLRYLIKDEGVENWEEVKLNPVVAYSPKYMGGATLCGIAYWNGRQFKIIHSEELMEFELLNRWLNLIMTNEQLDFEAEALLKHNTAIIVTDVEMEDHKSKSWEQIIIEVLYGHRSSNYTSDTNTSIIKNYNLLESYFDKLLGDRKGEPAKEVYKPAKLQPVLDFPLEWKKKWV